MLRGFRLWLVDNDIRERRQKLKDERYNKRLPGPIEFEIKNYFWIEKLLQTSIPCFRRYSLYRIIIPYLINVRGLSYNECFDISYKWLERCNSISRISFDKEVEIKLRLNSVKNYLPLSIKKLRNENNELYDLIFLH